jgi:2-hydroxymuconate-semialdehyde hydrolase
MSYLEREFVLAGIPVHYLESQGGPSGALPLLLLHGSGPGASTLGNWRRILEPLAAAHPVFAMDLIGFGRSGRKPSPPYFDMPLWLQQCREMIARIPGERIGIIGHSLSGALALKLATAEPRVAKVLTTGTMGAPFVVNEWTLRTWTFPKTRAELRLAAQGLIHDPALIDDAYLDGRMQVLQAGDYETYFSDMFPGDKQRFADAALLTADEIARIRCDVTFVHGRNDRAFPAEPLTLALARQIPHADVVLLGRCSHSIAMEHPDKLLAAAGALFH